MCVFAALLPLPWVEDGIGWVSGYPAYKAGGRGGSKITRGLEYADVMSCYALACLYPSPPHIREVAMLPPVYVGSLEKLYFFFFVSGWVWGLLPGLTDLGGFWFSGGFWVHGRAACVSVSWKDARGFFGGGLY